MINNLIQILDQINEGRSLINYSAMALDEPIEADGVSIFDAYIHKSDAPLLVELGGKLGYALSVSNEVTERSGHVVYTVVKVMLAH